MQTIYLSSSSYSMCMQRASEREKDRARVEGTIDRMTEIREWKEKQNQSVRVCVCASVSLIGVKNHTNEQKWSCFFFEEIHNYGAYLSANSKQYVHLWKWTGKREKNNNK